MQQKESTAYKTVGIIGLVLGALAFVFSFVPCLGIYAIWPGAAGIVLAIISLSMASKAAAGKGIAITALCLAVVGTGVATWQFMALRSGVEHLDAAFKEIDKSMDSLKKANEANEVKYDEPAASDKSIEEAQKAIDSLNNAAQPTEAATK